MKKVKHFILEVLCSIILILCILIGCKKSDSFKNNLYNHVYNNNISFGYLNTLYNKYLGPILPFKLNIDTKPVFKPNLEYKNANIYKDGCVLEVDNNYLVPSISGGLVVFVGEKEGYGNTIIIESEDGIEIWYGNLNNLNIKLYDYIEKGTYLGETINNQLYLVFKNNGEKINYEEYIN